MCDEHEKCNADARRDAGSVWRLPPSSNFGATGAARVWAAAGAGPGSGFRFKGSVPQTIVVQGPLGFVGLCWTLEFLKGPMPDGQTGDAGCWMLEGSGKEAPSTNIQAPEKFQAPRIKHRRALSDRPALPVIPVVSGEFRWFPAVSGTFEKNVVLAYGHQAGRVGGCKAFEDEDEDDCQFAKRPMKTKKLNQIKPRIF
jgi:hypothetical protein